MSNRNHRTSRPCHSGLPDDGVEIPPEEYWPYMDNEFVEDYRNGRIVYSDDFYIALYKKIHDKGMTYVQAYNALGLNTDVLGTDRANAAGKRAVKMAEGNRLFTVSPANYKGSVPREMMGDLTPEEELAYLKARNAYLERMVEAQKKIPSILAGIHSS